MKAIIVIALTAVNFVSPVQFLEIFKGVSETEVKTNGTNATLDSGCIRFGTLSALKVCKILLNCFNLPRISQALIEGM